MCNNTESCGARNITTDSTSCKISLLLILPVYETRDTWVVAGLSSKCSIIMICANSLIHSEKQRHNAALWTEDNHHSSSLIKTQAVRKYSSRIITNLIIIIVIELVLLMADVL